MKAKIKSHIWHPTYKEDENYFFKVYNESLIKTNCQEHETYAKKLRFYSLFQLAYNSLKKNKNFNFAECGCFKGQSTYGISRILKDLNFQNNFYVFDSFEGGLSDFQSQDKILLNKDITDSQIEKRKQQYSSDEYKVKENLKEFDFMRFFKGWIPTEFYNVKDLNFQFVHIDVDLYQPTYDSISFFYPRLTSGGIIVCDDYNFTDFPGAKTAWDEYFKEIDEKPKFIYEVPLGSIFLIK